MRNLPRSPKLFHNFNHLQWQVKFQKVAQNSQYIYQSQAFSRQSAVAKLFIFIVFVDNSLERFNVGNLFRNKRKMFLANFLHTFEKHLISITSPKLETANVHWLSMKKAIFLLQGLIEILMIFRSPFKYEPLAWRKIGQVFFYKFSVRVFYNWAVMKFFIDVCNSHNILRSLVFCGTLFRGKYLVYYCLVNYQVMLIFMGVKCISVV